MQDRSCLWIFVNEIDVRLFCEFSLSHGHIIVFKILVEVHVNPYYSYLFSNSFLSWGGKVIFPNQLYMRNCHFVFSASAFAILINFFVKHPYQLTSMSKRHGTKMNDMAKNIFKGNILMIFLLLHMQGYAGLYRNLCLYLFKYIRLQKLI